MGFNYTTLLEFIFGLIPPAAIILYLILSKRRDQIAFSAIGYGFLSFMGSVIAVFIVFVAANALFLSSITFEDDSSGLTLAGAIICGMVAVIYGVCETLKIMTIKKFKAEEKRTRMSGAAFAAGVILAQNAVIFIALNMFDKYSMDARYALFSGGIVCVTGIMYTVLSAACQVMVGMTANNLPAFMLSAVYYLFWIAAVICSRSTVLIYTATVLFLLLTFVLSGVFLFKTGKSKNFIGDIIDN